MSRPGSSFDIIENDGGADIPAFVGSNSLSPFNDEDSSTPFILNFGNSVTSFSLVAGDFGGDTPDRVTVVAYSGKDATGSQIAIETALIRTIGNGALFNYAKIAVSAARLIGSVSFIGGTPNFPHSVYYDNFTANTVTNQQASVLGSFSAFIDQSKNYQSRRPTLQQQIDCTKDLACDLDALQNAMRSENIKLVKSANEAAFQSADLVTRTELIAPTLIENAIDAKFLITNAIDGLKILGRAFLGSSPEPENASVEGTVGLFQINPIFNPIDAILTFDLPWDKIHSEWDGVEVFNAQSFLGSASAAGVYRFNLLPSSDQLTSRFSLSLLQLESNDLTAIAPVPLSASFFMLLAALITILTLKLKGRNPQMLN